MRFPVIELLQSAAIRLSLKVTGLSGSKNLIIDGGFSAGKLAQIDVDGETLIWVDPGSLGGGTVTSVGLSLPSSVFDISGSPVTGTGTLTAAFKTQGAFEVLLSDGAGNTSFGSLLASHIPTLDAGKIGSGIFDVSRLPVGTSASTVAAGNDSRFHSQNTDLGTNSSTFYIGTSGPKIKNDAGAIALRNNADTAYVDIVVRNLIVQGTQTIVNTEEVTIADNIILLNSDFTGATPTEDAGIEIERGTQTNARIIWSESEDRVKSGLAGSELIVANKREETFTDASLTGGILTFAHGLGENITYTVWMDNGEEIKPGATKSNANGGTLTLNFGSVAVTNTWTLVVVG